MVVDEVDNQLDSTVKQSISDDVNEAKRATDPLEGSAISSQVEISLTFPPEDRMES
jgi:hypothetical protein